MKSFVGIVMTGLAIALGGCANNAAFRGLATNTGVAVTTLRTGTSEFIQQQTALNSENADRLDLLAGYTSRQIAASRRQELAWTAAGRSDLYTPYRLATSRSGTDILASMGARATRFEAVPDGGTDAAYETAQNALAKLARKPSAASILGGLLTYAGEVQDELAKLRKAAADAAAAAATKGDDAGEATTTSLEPATAATTPVQ